MSDENKTKETSFLDKYKSNNEMEIIPSITDPDNKLHILAIKHDTKTGYRMAMPLSPIGYDWLKDFNLIRELNLPEIDNPLGFQTKAKNNYNCTNKTSRWFWKHKYGFTPHALRHAYNHRAHQQGLNPKLIADSLGHSLQMNQSTYLRSMNSSRQVQMMKEAINQVQDEQSTIKKLEAEIKHLKTENERLKTELKMYKMLENKS